MAEVKFPTEVVDLPSQGLLYPTDSPLSSGKIEIKYMTAREEDILTSANLIKKGVVIEKLLESLVIDKSIIEVDLTQLKDKKLDESKVSKGVNEFDFELPATKRKLTFKLLTSGDEKEIEKEIEGYRKIGDGIGYDLTTRLKYQIVSIDGDSKRASINSFVENEFLSRDSMAFRNEVSRIMPDVDMTSKYIDSEGTEKEFTVPMTVTFLWPSS